MSKPPVPATLLGAMAVAPTPVEMSRDQVIETVDWLYDVTVEDAADTITLTRDEAYLVLKAASTAIVTAWPDAWPIVVAGDPP